MPGIVLTFPIIASKLEAWRRFCQELSGSRLQMYITSRRRMGITYERVTLVETADGSTAVTTLEAVNVDRALGQIITSILPFDRWYRERIRELHGVDIAGYELFSQRTQLPSDQELLFEWSLNKNVDS
jgi:hypothetical protein